MKGEPHMNLKGLSAEVYTIVSSNQGVKLRHVMSRLSRDVERGTVGAALQRLVKWGFLVSYSKKKKSGSDAIYFKGTLEPAKIKLD